MMRLDKYLAERTGMLTDAWVKMNHSMYHDGVKLAVRSQQRS